MFDMVIKIRLSRQGAVHVEVATSYIHQADGYWVNGDFDKVVELYSHAIKIFKEIHGDESKQVAQLYGWTGVAHTYAGRWEESLDSIGQAMILVDKAFEVYACSVRLYAGPNATSNSRRSCCFLRCAMQMGHE